MEEKAVSIRQNHQAVMRNLNLPEEVIEYVNSIENDIICEWLYICALEGMQLKDLQKLGQKRTSDVYKKVSAIHTERKKFLHNLYRDNPEVNREVENMYQQVKTMYEESRELRAAVESSLKQAGALQTDAYERQIQTYELAMQSKDDMIAVREKQIKELETQLEEFQTISENKRQEEKILPETKEKHAGLFQKMFADYRSQKFIEQYLKNDSYSPEQQEYLLECFQSGMPLGEIKKIASPYLSVETMERIRHIKS